MKRLYLIRHAKSDWGDTSLDDFDRPLNHRGQQNAPFMGELLQKKGIIPDIIISSPAIRALSTAKIIAEKLGYTKPIIPNQYIYDAYITALQECIQYIHDSNETAFVVGHNPGITTLAYMLCGFKEQMPTCAIVEIKFDCDSWMDIAKENAQLISYEYPKKYTT